ncbi:MAG TPA: TolC family protein, partial [Nitrosomonas sp.]|nr:TolC family protein [Nitrosomonas sp.]
MQISSLWYLLLSLGLIVSSPLIAQQKTRVTIEEVQRLGLEANGMVLAARSQVDMARAGVVAAS